MRRSFKIGVSLLMMCVLLLTSLSLQSFEYNAESVIGNSVADFKLRNVDGKFVSLADYKTAKGFIIVFTCNHCPFAKLYTQRLNDLNTKYKALGVPLLAVNSMDSMVYEEESYKEMRKKSLADHFNFPYLYDNTQAVGSNFGAEHTPHAYVIWKENNVWKIKYSGAIDDNGEEPTKAIPYIANAVDELLKGKLVSMPITNSVGCKIFYRAH